MATRNRIVIEQGHKKVFASALDWPGWSRSGSSEMDAIEVLIGYADRYRNVTERAGVGGIEDLVGSPHVIERISGSGATDFGVPDKVGEADHETMSAIECERQLMILQACWDEFDAIAARVSEELRKGPRGGGRNRSDIVDHTLEADRGYARRIGVMTPGGYGSDPDEVRMHRERVMAAVRQANGGKVETKWPLRYFIRRAAWHMLDHAWEMEDKDLSQMSEGKVIHASSS